MSDSKHTPGPWMWQPGARSNLVHIEVEATRDPICSLPKARMADATLIAAAPELLAALRDMVGQHDLNPERLLSAMHLWDAARAAIAKAEGR